MMNDVYMSGFVRNFERESQKMIDLDKESKGHENGFLKETVSFEKLNGF